MDFADQELLNGIVNETTTSGGGLKTMIRELVMSDLFQSP